MKAQLLAEPGRFETIDLPDPAPGEGEAVIEVTAVAICGSDLAAFRGTHPAIRPPTVIGHEFSGVIKAIGPGVTTAAPGDRVCVDPTSGCGVCRFCAQGRHNICTQYRNMGRDLGDPGGMAGLVSVPVDRVHAIPGEMDLDPAALVQPLSVAYHAAVHRGRVSGGDTVLVAGAGAIGMGVLLAAKDVGARAIVTDRVPSRLEMAREFGADVVLDPEESNLSEVVALETDGYGVDLAFEAVGGTSDALLLEIVGLTAPGGTVVVVGLKTDLARLPIKQVKYAEKTITGSQAHPDSFPAVIGRIVDGRFPAERMISHRVPFSEAARAFEILDGRQDGVMKIVLKPDTV